MESLALKQSHRTISDVVHGFISDFDATIWGAIIDMFYGANKTTLKIAIERFKLYMDDPRFRKNGYCFNDRNRDQLKTDLMFCMSHWNHRVPTRSHSDSLGVKAHVKDALGFAMLGTFRLMQAIPPPDGSRTNNHNTVCREVVMLINTMWILLTRPWIDVSVDLIDEFSLTCYRDFKVLNKQKWLTECQCWDGNWEPDDDGGVGGMMYRTIVNNTNKEQHGEFGGVDNTLRPFSGAPKSIWETYKKLAHSSTDEIPLAEDYTYCECGTLVPINFDRDEGLSNSNQRYFISCPNPKCDLDAVEFRRGIAETTRRIQLQANGADRGFVEVNRRVLQNQDNALWSVYISPIKAKFTMRAPANYKTNGQLPNPLAAQVMKWRKGRLTMTATLMSLLHAPFVTPALQMRPVYPTNHGGRRRTNSTVENCIKSLKGGNSKNVRPMGLKTFSSYLLQQINWRNDQVIVNGGIPANRRKRVGTNTVSGAKERLAMMEFMDSDLDSKDDGNDNLNDTNTNLDCDTNDNLHCGTNTNLDCDTNDNLHCDTNDNLVCDPNDNLDCDPNDNLDCGTKTNLNHDTNDNLHHDTNDNLDYGVNDDDNSSAVSMAIPPEIDVCPTIDLSSFASTNYKEGEFAEDGTTDTTWCRNPVRDLDLNARMSSFKINFKIDSTAAALQHLRKHHGLKTKLRVCDFDKMCQNKVRYPNLRVSLNEALSRAMPREKIRAMNRDRRRREALEAQERLRREMERATPMFKSKKKRKKFTGKIRRRKRIVKRINRLKRQ